MPESAFINAVAAFLRGTAGLTPAPAGVGIAAPLAVIDAPAIVLSLPEVRRVSTGRGAELATGALPVDVTIDLANPFEPDAPGFSLIDAARLSLILPHGGLVRNDGDTGPLGPADFSLTVNGVAQPTAAPPPAAGQISVDARQGIVTFATPLPPAGTIAVHYQVGTWERRTTLLGGRLLLTVHATDAGDVESLSVGATRALLASNLPGLRSIAMEDLGAIGAPDPQLADMRARSANFRFQYEHVIDDAFSSGGIIRQIPLTTTLNALRIDPATGLENVDSVTETG